MGGGGILLWEVRERGIRSAFSLSRLRRYPTAIFSYPMGNWKKDGTGLFSVAMGSKGNSDWTDIVKKIFISSGAAPKHGLGEWRNIHPWKYSKANWTEPWAICSVSEAGPAVSRRGDELTSEGKVLSHLNSVILTCLTTCAPRSEELFTSHHWCQVSLTLSSAGTLPSWLKHWTPCLNTIIKAHGTFCVSQLALCHAWWHSKLADLEACSLLNSEFLLSLPGLLWSLLRLTMWGPPSEAH